MIAHSAELCLTQLLSRQEIILKLEKWNLVLRTSERTEEEFCQMTLKFLFSLMTTVSSVTQKLLRSKNFVSCVKRNLVNKKYKTGCQSEAFLISMNSLTASAQKK